MKSKFLLAHSSDCWAKKKSNPWSGGILKDMVFRDAIFRRGGHWTWFVWCCACPGCPAEIAVRYDAMAPFINKMAKKAKSPPTGQPGGPAHE